MPVHNPFTVLCILKMLYHFAAIVKCPAHWDYFSIMQQVECRKEQGWKGLMQKKWDEYMKRKATCYRLINVHLYWTSDCLKTWFECVVCVVTNLTDIFKCTNQIKLVVRKRRYVCTMWLQKDLISEATWCHLVIIKWSICQNLFSRYELLPRGAMKCLYFLHWISWRL